jgi:hypothetical protein
LAARHTPNPNRDPAPRADLEARLHEAGAGAPRWWGNGAGDTYGWHDHGYRKVLYCRSGSITFHTREGDLQLGPGDRLELDPGTEHAATVGPDGCECVEASA